MAPRSLCGRFGRVDVPLDARRLGHCCRRPDPSRPHWIDAAGTFQASGPDPPGSRPAVAVAPIGSADDVLGAAGGHGLRLRLCPAAAAVNPARPQHPDRGRRAGGARARTAAGARARGTGAADVARRARAQRSLLAAGRRSSRARVRTREQRAARIGPAPGALQPDHRPDRDAGA